MSIYAPIRKAIRTQADTVGSKLLEGQFADYAAAKGLVERRKGLLEAIDILNETIKLEEEDGEV